MANLAAAAAKLDVPKKESVKLKPRSEWRYIGKGTASYDLKICAPEGSYGRILIWKECFTRALHIHRFFGSSVKSVDDKAALALRA